MEDITIHIYASGQGGYKYDIYNGSPQSIAEDDSDSYYGGHCTTTLANALAMAQEGAQYMVEHEHVRKGHDRPEEVARSLYEHESREEALDYLVKECGYTHAKAEAKVSAF